MGKVLGAIFTVAGSFITLFLTFVYLNTSAYLNYNTEKSTLQEVGLTLPILLGLTLLVVGITFLKFDKEGN